MYFVEISLSTSEVSEVSIVAPSMDLLSLMTIFFPKSVAGVPSTIAVTDFSSTVRIVYFASSTVKVSPTSTFLITPLIFIAVPVANR